jgi:HSP20 family protein
MKRRNQAEEMFNDIVDTLKDKQKDLERTVNEYTSNISIRLAMDVIDDSDEVTVITDLPGVERDGIKIDITEDTLEISARFNQEFEVEGKDFVRKERKYGGVNRVISLPAKIKINETSAKFENGVLTIILPKLNKEQSFEVKVD